MSTLYPGKEAGVALSVIANDELMAILESGPLDEAVVQLSHYSDKFVSFSGDDISKRELKRILARLHLKAKDLHEQLNAQLGGKLMAERLWISVICIDRRIMGCVNANKRMVLLPPHAGPNVHQIHEVAY